MNEINTYWKICKIIGLINNRWIHNGVASLPRKKPRVRNYTMQSILQIVHQKTFSAMRISFPITKILQSFTIWGIRMRMLHQISHMFTYPLYVKSLEKKCETTRANMVYKKIAQTSCQPEHVPVFIPRNVQQLRTIKF